MSRVYESTFTIRHYECDASGRVNPANYLRFMQEAAYAASADVGYDMVGYHALGSLWFIRETEIVFDQPLRYGDCISVRTWVEDFHRVRSLRAYELRTVGSEEPVARAWSDWVYLDTETGLPTSIPGEMVAAFIPNPSKRLNRPRRRFPVAEGAGGRSFTQQRRVDWRDLDPIQHVNNAVYFSYLEECGLSADRALGWSVERMAEEGIGQVIKKLHIEYRQPAVYNDLLEISTWISSVRAEMATRHFVVRRMSDGELLCQALMDFYWGRLASGEHAPKPEAWQRDLDRISTEVANE